MGGPRSDELRFDSRSWSAERSMPHWWEPSGSTNLTGRGGGRLSPQAVRVGSGTGWNPTARRPYTAGKKFARDAETFEGKQGPRHANGAWHAPCTDSVKRLIARVRLARFPKPTMTPRNDFACRCVADAFVSGLSAAPLMRGDSMDASSAQQQTRHRKRGFCSCVLYRPSASFRRISRTSSTSGSSVR